MKTTSTKKDTDKRSASGSSKKMKATSADPEKGTPEDTLTNSSAVKGKPKPPRKGTGKRKGRESPFTDPQRNYIDETYTKEWIDLVNKYRKPKHKGILLEWKKTAAKAVIKSELFRGKLDDSRTKDQWRQVSVLIYYKTSGGNA